MGRVVQPDPVALIGGLPPTEPGPHRMGHHRHRRILCGVENQEKQPLLNPELDIAPIQLH